MEPIDKARELWRRGQDPQEWAEKSAPEETLVYRRGHPRQIKDLHAIGHVLDLRVKVAGSHRSKSVDLPVGVFRVEVIGSEEAFMFTRDNFHDLKVVVVSSCPINHLPYEVAHDQWTQEHYQEEKRRAYEYLRPKPERDFPGSHNFDESHYETDEWYSKWSRGTILRHDGNIYRAGSTFAGYYEGIEDLLPEEVFVRYEHGRQNFAVEVPGGILRQMEIMQWVVRSVQKVVQDRRQRQRDLESLEQYRVQLSEGDELTEYQQKKFDDLKAKYEG